jgi:hypothetical protein
MAIDYLTVFKQRIGQMDANSPWSDERITTMLDQAAVKASRSFATPWGEFSDVTEAYKWPIVITAAIEYWWAKAGSYVEKVDIRSGSGVGKSASDLFDRALRMIRMLEDELEEFSVGGGFPIEGSGDILVGDLVIRSKETGYLVPRSDDVYGDWTG